LFQIALAEPAWRFGDPTRALLGNRSYSQLSQMAGSSTRVSLINAFRSVGKLGEAQNGTRTRQTCHGALERASVALDSGPEGEKAQINNAGFYVAHLNSNIRIFQLQLSSSALDALSRIDLRPMDSVAYLEGIFWSEIYEQSGNWATVFEIAHQLYDHLPWLLSHGLELREGDTLADIGSKLSKQASALEQVKSKAALNLSNLLPSLYGWGEHRISLDALGERVGLSQERIRQLSLKVSSHLKSGQGMFHPALQAVLDHTVENHRDDIADALRLDGFKLSKEWDERSLRTLFQCAGMGDTFESWLVENEITSEHKARDNQIDAAIRKARTELGTVKLTTVEFPVGGFVPIPEVVSRLRVLYSHVYVEGDYALVSRKGQAGLVSEARSQLYVKQPLSLEVIAQGIKQAAVARNCSDVIPPGPVIGKLLLAAGLEVDDAGQFTGPTQQVAEAPLQLWLYNFISNATNKIVSKPDVFRAAAKEGHSLNSLGIYLSYKSWIRFLRDNLFTLVGNNPHSEEIEFAKNVDAAKYVANKNAEYRISEDGKSIYVDAFFSTPFLVSGIISMDSSLTEVLGASKRKINCCAKHESDANTLARPSAWHGFAFLRQHLLQEHDFSEGDTLSLKVTKDLVSVIL